MDELARQYADTQELEEALSMEEYKNYFVNGGGLFDWLYSSKFRAMSVVLQVPPGGTTVVIKRFVAAAIPGQRRCRRVRLNTC